MSLQPHFQATSYIVRFYEKGLTYENGDPYAAVCTVQMVGDYAYVSGFLGTLTRLTYRRLRDALVQHGAKRIFYERSTDGWREVSTASPLRFKRAS